MVSVEVIASEGSEGEPNIVEAIPADEEDIVIEVNLTNNNSNHFYTNPSPEDNAGFFSRILYLWATRLFVLTRKKNKVGEELEQEDLFDVPSSERTSVLTAVFDDKWNNFVESTLKDPSKKANAAPQLKWSLWKVTRKRMIFAGFLKFLNSTIQFGYPLILNGLLDYILNIDTSPSYEGYVWVGSLGVLLILKGIIENYYFWLTQRAGYEVRSTISTSVFKKSLRLSSSSRQKYSQGQIVNLMQLDAQKLQNFCNQLHILWDGLYQIAGYTLIVYFLLGNSVFIGLGVLLVSLPIQILVTIKIFGYTARAVKVTDKRVKKSNELLQSILGVKLAAWEDKFFEAIEADRKKELGILKASFIYRSLLMSIFQAMPAVVAVSAIVHFALTNGDISAAILFASLQGFSSLRFPLLMYPMAIQSLADARVSQVRLAKFMALDESNSSEKENLDDNYTGEVVRIEDGIFFWSDPNDAKEVGGEDVADKQKNTDISPENDDTAVLLFETSLPVLENINIRIERGELVGIIGNVGSGKSSLLQSMLGELHQTEGITEIRGKVSYSAQSAWILNMTLRENIVFGSDFDEERYWEVIRVCQLEHDLETLQDGDMTIIGERGINLSGGQAQRVSVARAVYSSADIVILDDPLSALDPEVASRLFEECIVGFLSDKTRIMVTNQLNFLPKCDHVIALSGGADSSDDEDVVKARVPGTIAEQGSYQSLVSSGLDFAALMAKFNGDSDSDTDAIHVNVDEIQNEPETLEAAAPTKIKKNHELMQVEERAKGAVSFSEYSEYIRAGGGWCFFGLVIVVLLVSQAISVGSTVVVSIWSDDADYENLPLNAYIGMYAGSAVVFAVFKFFESYILLSMGLYASKSLHDLLLNGILAAPMSFFDTTPTGRIVSRFSKDIFSLDNELPQFFQFFLFTFIFVLYSLGTVVYTIWLFVFAIPVLVIIYFYIVQYYRPTARDCKRLEAISRSPVYAHFQETVNGLGSIRAYGKEEEFIRASAEKIDFNIKGFYCVTVIERWLALRLEVLAALIATVAGCLIVYGAIEGQVTAGFAGLAMSFILALTGLLGQTVRSFVRLEAGMNSVERLSYYGNSIERAASMKSDDPPPEDWPSMGNIDIQDLTMRYRPETPLVLRGVTVSIPGGSTVGIVGRTGSGKSSLFLTLLRIVEPESGIVRIDGIDTNQIGLHELRKKVSIVPQNPVIFSGTVRSNLDPFNEYTEEQLWEALQRSNLKRAVEELENGLDEEVAEYGENFSQGQRQLLCMSRSLLSHSKILFLDEATSSVDYETDASIQNTIREGFKNCTILTIAHRIQTVIDNDAILVMDQGQVAEFAPAKDLLDNPDSSFSSMVSELGPAAEANLRKLANQ